MTSKPILIYDTTLRDGSQGEGVSFSLQDKLNIAQRLAEVGIDFIEGGYPLSNEKDVAFFREVRKLNLGHAKVCAFGMTRRRGIAAAGRLVRVLLHLAAALGKRARPRDRRRQGSALGPSCDHAAVREWRAGALADAAPWGVCCPELGARPG